MARIFVATDTALGRRVVIKVLASDVAASVNAERFHREVRLAASLQHPHVVPLHAAGQADGLLYYTMPFVAGESLRQRLDRDGPLPIAEVVRLLREVADASALPIGRGIIHRDLKPANVLLSEGHALVADFGIAKALVAATSNTPHDSGARHPRSPPPDWSWAPQLTWRRSKRPATTVQITARICMPWAAWATSC